MQNDDIKKSIQEVRLVHRHQNSVTTLGVKLQAGLVLSAQILEEFRGTGIQEFASENQIVDKFSEAINQLPLFLRLKIFSSIKTS